MNRYERLLDESYNEGIIVKEVPLKSNSDGLYITNKIALNTTRLNTRIEKSCILAEELGHHYTSVGDVLDLNNLSNAKQEYQARLYSYNKLIGLMGIVKSFEAGCVNKHEIAEYLEVTEEFLEGALNCYKDKYGISVDVDNYTICFVPNILIYKRL